MPRSHSSPEPARPAPWKGYLALGLLRLCAALSLPAAQALGRGLGRLIWRFAGKTRAVVDCNLAACFPELSVAERRRLGREALENVGESFTEAGPLWLWSAEKLAGIAYDVVGAEVLSEALAQGRGVLVALPHLGAWEFINGYLMSHSRFVAMYRTPRLPELDPVMRGARERMGARLVPASPAGVKALMKHLVEGGLSVVLPDQEPEPSGGVFAPFFGIPALTQTLYARLLARTGAVPIFAYVERLRGPVSFRIVFRPAPEGIASDDALIAAEALNRGVEACVRALPGQYQWNYKRFNTRPDAGRKPYGWFRREPEAALAALRSGITLKR